MTLADHSPEATADARVAAAAGRATALPARQVFARAVRQDVVRMVHRARASHVGGALSMVDILATLYGPSGHLRTQPTDPAWPARDRFFLSKGHACASLYATLAQAGFFPVSDLMGYAQDGSPFMAHASHKVPGVELSTGSLGHGLPVATGFAYGARLRHLPSATVALLSDGELDEGSNWEAILFAAHHGLDMLRVVIDANAIQSLGAVQDVLTLEPLADKFSSFGWAVREIDGHDLAALDAALDLRQPFASGRPGVVIARTIKGKGVSFMEHSLDWHYRSPSDEQLAAALAELAAN